MRRFSFLVIASFLALILLAGINTAHAAPARACYTPTDDATHTYTTAYKHGFTNGCLLGQLNRGNSVCASPSGTKYSTGTTAEQTDWTKGCADGYSHGFNGVLADKLSAMGTNLANIGSSCSTLGDSNEDATDKSTFVNGCRIGYLGGLWGFSKNYHNTGAIDQDWPFEYVCGFATHPNPTQFNADWDYGCADGHQAGQAASAAGATPPSGSTPPSTPPSGSTPPSIPPSGSTPPSGTGNPPSTVQDVIRVIESLTNWMFTIFLIIAVMMIIYAAFVYLTSEGGEGVEKAHKMLLYSAVAIAVATLSKSIVLVVAKLVSV